MSREQLLELAAGMRQAADWIEANADLPLRTSAVQVQLRTNDREGMTAAAHAFGSFDKLGNKDSALAAWDYIIAKWFGGFRLQIHCDRGKICKRVKVLKEVDEWACDDSILAPELPATAD